MANTTRRKNSRQKAQGAQSPTAAEEWVLPSRKKPALFPPGVDLSTSRRGRVREMSWAEFDRLIQALARQVAQAFRVEAVVGVAHGGVFAGGALAKALGVEFFPVRISRRSRDVGSPQIYGKMPKELSGKRVLVVDDVAASGETLELAIEKARAVKALGVKTAALVARKEGYQPDCHSLLTDDFIVFPWDYQPLSDVRLEVDNAAPRKPLPGKRRVKPAS